jgi:hypothetical protein
VPANAAVYRFGLHKAAVRLVAVRLKSERANTPNGITMQKPRRVPCLIEQIRYA